MRYLALFVAASHLAACSSNDAETDPRDGGVSDMEPDAPPPRCEFDDLLETEFSDGPYGTMRHDIAADFSLELTDGTTFTLSENWNGCDSYLFVPDSLRVSQVDPTSLWESTADLRELTNTDNHPSNVHYFFISRAFNDELAEVATAAMTLRIEDALEGLNTQEEADYWRERLHVVATRAANLDNYVGGLLQSGIGVLGFAIDREQTLRGIGSVSDINRPNRDTGWPDSNLSYVAYEARRYNYEATLRERLATENATVVSLWSGEVLSEFEETAIQLPDAAQMAEFDTFEIDVTMRCPDSNQIEPGNCGEWDYLAHLFVYNDAEERVELGRFITSYSREGRMIVDATPMLVHLLEGGERTFRWEFAPPWNVQPTATWLDLRFSNRGKGYKPVEAHFLWTGGSFTDGYNTTHPDVEVPIPADAVRIELWAIITGHGNAESQCAEFCDHHHEFTVEGSVYTRTHPAVEDDIGCRDEIDNGVVPNQWGTWWFGRGGWCPGQQVEPFVVDVTGDVTPESTATVSYRGLFFGADPTGNKGNIRMVSYLVFYR